MSLLAVAELSALVVVVSLLVEAELSALVVVVSPSNLLLKFPPGSEISYFLKLPPGVRPSLLLPPESEVVVVVASASVVVVLAAVSAAASAVAYAAAAGPARSSTAGFTFVGKSIPVTDNLLVTLSKAAAETFPTGSTYVKSHVMLWQGVGSPSTVTIT